MVSSKQLFHSTYRIASFNPFLLFKDKLEFWAPSYKELISIANYLKEISFVTYVQVHKR